MALRVWLPLNGNLKNKGLTNIGDTPLLNSLILQDNGKLGKCYKGAALYHLQEDFLKNQWTIAVWVKQDGSSWQTYNDIILCKNNSAAQDGQFYLSVIGGNKLNIGINKHSEQYKYDYTFATNTWYHVAAAFNGTNYYLYLNGNLVLTGIDTSVYDGTALNLTLNGRSQSEAGSLYSQTKILNDVRIYDECLSQKEIKEISKGLACHYQFKELKALTNLRKNISFGGYNNYSSSGATCSVAKTGEKYNGADIWRMTYTPSESCLSHVQTTLWGHGVTNESSTYNANTKYCYWLLCKPISHSDTIVGGVASNIGGWTEISMTSYKDGWYVVGQYRNGSVTSNKSDTIYTSFKTPSATVGTPITIDFCCPHLLAGYDQILWEADEPGTEAPYEPDISGYGYEGQQSGILAQDLNDSPKYNSSTIFTQGYLHYLSSPLHEDTDAFTLSTWFYPTSNTTMTIYNDRTAVGDGFSIFYINGNIRFDTGSNYQWEIASRKPVLNTWNHIVVTFDKINGKKYYLNGELISSTANAGTLANIGTNASIGNSSTNGAAGAGNQLLGKLSDFRIYCTELSADDIRQLYETSSWIDNQQNLYGLELEENDAKILSQSDWIAGHTNFGTAVFTRTLVSDINSPSGQATLFECTTTGSGYYIGAGVEPWKSGKINMINGEKYKMTMWVKMNREHAFKMNVECGSSQSQNSWTVGTEYQKLENTFYYNSSATYSAITNYANFEVGDKIWIHSFKVEKVENTKINKNGIINSNHFNENLSNFEQLEYIESSGTQYIDTEVISKPTLTIIADFQFTSTSPAQQRVFGRVSDNGSTTSLDFDFYINGSSKWAWGCQNSTGNWTSTNKSTDTNRHTITLDSYNNLVTLDDVYSVEISTTRTIIDPAFIYLHAANVNASGVGRQASMKLYSCQIWDNNIAIRNFLPMERKSDGIIGLYDTVNNKFYTNKGTGTFTGGELQNNIIEDKVKIYNDKVMAHDFYEI